MHVSASDIVTYTVPKEIKMHQYANNIMHWSIYGWCVGRMDVQVVAKDVRRTATCTARDLIYLTAIKSAKIIMN